MGVYDSEAKKEMQGALDHLVEELKNIRTGRANTGMIESVRVEVYGTEMRMSDVANLSVPEPQQIMISPFDASNAAAIGKAIELANLGMQVVTESNLVRVMVPAMDESVRKEMAKQCSKKCEDAKIAIRNIRRKFNDKARDAKKAGEIGEDILNVEEKAIQKLTDDFCKKADDLSAAKEKEVMTV